jgi:invasion protein IalB
MVRTTAWRASLLGLALVIAGHIAIAQDAVSALPNGASSVQETYQDWLVTCVQAEAAKRCALSQQQSQADGQRVLAIELLPSKDGGLTGAMVLPFGLALDAGATLQVDEQAPLGSLRFSTCLPAGCIVPIRFDDAVVLGLRQGSSLKVNLSLEGSAEPVPLTISLRGFSVALDRTMALSE